mmetsp:Transcript_28748/g.61054  ORF Transcript_28748/g.61054 Transcript_28748/m.61054 type:complete len:400 (+) Transcript_28748:98-1297(+)
MPFALEDEVPLVYVALLPRLDDVKRSVHHTRIMDIGRILGILEYWSSVELKEVHLVAGSDDEISTDDLELPLVAALKLSLLSRPLDHGSNPLSALRIYDRPGRPVVDALGSNDGDLCLLREVHGVPRLGRDAEIAILISVQLPRDTILQAHKEVVKLYMALLTIIVEERVRYVLLNDIDVTRLRNSHAILWSVAAHHAGAPVPVSLLDKPGHGRTPRRLRWRWLSNPLLIFDDVCQRHQVRDELIELALILQPNPPLDVHGDAAEIRLVREVDTPAPKRAMANRAGRVLEPLLAGIGSPVRALQQVVAEALAVAPNMAIRTIEPLPRLIRRRRDTGTHNMGAPVMGDVIDGLSQDHHLLVALLDLLLHALGLLSAALLLDLATVRRKSQFPGGRLRPLG